MANIQDVAKQAGVAPITVSRVINDSGYVSQEKRERVKAAIAELGYVPNSLARSLRFKETKTIALILTDITNPFWTTVARGVEDAASERGYNVILCNTDESEAKQASYLPVLLQKQVDGFILVPARNTADSVQLIQKHGSAVVVLDRMIPYSQVDIVRSDSEEGAYQLTRLLLDLGHKEIAILTGPKEVSTATDRVAGYQRAMVEAGLEANDTLVYHGRFVQSAGYKLMQQVLARRPRPTAIFAGNNFIAIGAIKALLDAGLRVPEDMAVVAFDDIPDNLVITPFLTVVAQQGYAMGQRATDLLLDRLTSQEPAAGYQEIILPTRLVIRQSSGKKYRAS